MPGISDFLRLPFGKQADEAPRENLTQQLDTVFRSAIVGAPATWAEIEPTIDPTMRAPASNTVGAWLRVAYWLGTAWRVQSAAVWGTSLLAYIAQQVPGGRLWSLAMAAGFAFAVAATAAGAGAARYLGVGLAYDVGAWGADTLLPGAPVNRSDDRKQIRAVYEWGIQMAGKLDAKMALRELQTLAAAPLPQDKNLPWYVTVGGAVALGGVALYLLRPYAEVGASITERLRGSPRVRKNPRPKRRGRRSRRS